MKAIICFTILIILFTSIAFSQSVMNYQSGTGIEVQSGADICADEVNINGTFSGGGTICGSTPYFLYLMAFIEGFYNFSTNTMVSDTVNIYLRNAASPFAIVDSARNVLSPNGEGSFIFFNISNGSNYYIVIKHRNSIETWSSSPVAFSSGTLTYDFTSAASKAYANNQAQIDALPVRFGIFSGDVNQDGIIDAGDLSLVDNDAFNAVSGYVATDVNGDNFVDASDLSIVDNNSFNNVLVRNPIVGDAVIRETSDVGH